MQALRCSKPIFMHQPEICIGTCHWVGSIQLYIHMRSVFSALTKRFFTKRCLVVWFKPATALHRMCLALQLASSIALLRNSLVVVLTFPFRNSVVTLSSQCLYPGACLFVSQSKLQSLVLKLPYVCILCRHQDGYTAVDMIWLTQLPETIVLLDCVAWLFCVCPVCMHYRLTMLPALSDCRPLQEQVHRGAGVGSRGLLEGAGAGTRALPKGVGAGLRGLLWGAGACPKGTTGGQGQGGYWRLQSQGQGGY